MHTVPHRIRSGMNFTLSVNVTQYRRQPTDATG